MLLPRRLQGEGCVLRKAGSKYNNAMSRIAHILGGWSVNIGNAFFQLAGHQLLHELFPQSEIVIVPEQPGYPSYWNRKGGNPENTFNYLKAIQPDYLVLMGPVFRKEIFSIWGNILEELTTAGTKLVLLGVGAMTYTSDDIRLYRDFLSRYRPELLITRDCDTFAELGDLAKSAFDGIDIGFFYSDYYTAPVIERLAGTVAVNFDKLPEPFFSLNKVISTADKQFEFKGDHWQVKFPRYRKWLAQKSRYGMFLEGLLFSGNQSERIGSYDVVRLDHRPHPMVRAKTYRYPQMMVNDTPFPYVNIYANCLLTLTDRVHAAVMALQNGKPAMLFSDSPRVRMLARLDLDDIVKQPVWLDKERLNDEKQALKSFFKAHLQ